VLLVGPADQASHDPQAVAKIVDLARDMKRYDFFHSDDPVEAAKFVVSEAVAALWESVLRHDGFAVFAGYVPQQLVRWEADYGRTHRGCWSAMNRAADSKAPGVHSVLMSRRGAAPSPPRASLLLGARRQPTRRTRPGAPSLCGVCGGL